MASSLYDNLRKIAAAQATQQNRGQATAPPTPEAIKARALRLADAALADAERSTDPAARVKHLDAAERAYKLAAAAQDNGASTTGGINIFVDTSAADDEPAAEAGTLPMTH